jgi:catechol 2,3-dioxygenase-like lactoylglutathione lyase family enzyme
VRFKLDHFHLFTEDPETTAKWYRDMLGARVLKRIQSNGKSRIDLDFDGVTVYVAQTPATSPRQKRTFFGPLPGLEHLGFHVDDVDAATAQLRAKGVEILLEPTDVRPDVRIAFIKGPDDVRIELLRRGPADFPSEPELLEGRNDVNA